MLMTLAVGLAAAQTPPPPPPQKAPPPKTKVEAELPLPPPAPKAPPGLPINVRIDVTITDQRGSAPPAKKTVSMLLADGQNGGVRSVSQIPTFKNSGGPPIHLPLNIDAAPLILEGNKVRLRLVLNVELPSQTGPTEDSRGEPGFNLTTTVTEQVTSILESGKPMVVAQSADPISDRQVTIEAKATILR